MKLRFQTNPWKHQKQAVKFLMPRDYGALYTDMGSGKTKIMIDLIVNRGWKRTIVVCPKKVCSVWAREFFVHSPEVSIRVINLEKISSGKRPSYIGKNELTGESDQEVIIINYEGIWREPLRTFLLNKYKADAVICDESHRIKSPSSKCSRFLSLLGKRTENRYLMTGTPLSQSPLDIYGQYRFLNSEIFGTNYNNFKNYYGNWIMTPGGYPILDRRNPYKNLDELREKMFSCAFHVEVEQNLPPTMDIDVEFYMSKKAQTYYKQIAKEGVIELKEGYMLAGNVLSVITRLQQVTSGYVPLQTDEGEIIKEIDDSRIVALKELLEDIPPEEPVVVFCKYRKDIKNVKLTCKEVGRTVSEVSGKCDEIGEWMDEKTNVLVVQISAGAEGINLTRARYNIYYTHHHSLGKYKQSRKRTHRPGQTRPVVYYHIIAKLNKGKTIDEKILESLKNNKELIDSIMEGEDLC